MPLPCVCGAHSYYPGTYATKPVEDQLAVFLDHLAFGGQLLPLSDSYGMAESTVKKSIARVSKALIKHFHTAVRPPTADEVTAWDEYNFRKFHLRGAVAAMDSTHIPLANVEIGVKTAYLNHKEGSQAFICHTVVSPRFVCVWGGAQCRRHMLLSTRLAACV